MFHGPIIHKHILGLNLVIGGHYSLKHSLNFISYYFEIDFRMCGLYSYSVGIMIMLAYYVQLAEYVFVFPI